MSYIDVTGKTEEEAIRKAKGNPNKNVHHKKKNSNYGGYTAGNYMAQKIMDNAKAQGAELLITACPLCSYNLLHNTDGQLPVVYVTALLAEALGCGEEDA